MVIYLMQLHCLHLYERCTDGNFSFSLCKTPLLYSALTITGFYML